MTRVRRTSHLRDGGYCHPSRSGLIPIRGEEEIQDIFALFELDMQNDRAFKGPFEADIKE